MDRPRPLTLLFAAVLGTAALALVGLHATERGQGALMGKFHLRPEVAASLLPLQVLPSMYNFANEAWWADAPVPWDSLGRAPHSSRAVYVQHYPVQVATGRGREFLAERSCPRYLYVQSRVRGDTLRSLYRFDATERGLRMTLADVDPAVRCTS